MTFHEQRLSGHIVLWSPNSYTIYEPDTQSQPGTNEANHSKPAIESAVTRPRNSDDDLGVPLTYPYLSRSCKKSSHHSQTPQPSQATFFPESACKGKAFLYLLYKPFVERERRDDGSNGELRGTSPRRPRSCQTCLLCGWGS